MSSRAAKRLNRILLMLPYVVSEDGASIAGLCKKFGITKEELTNDLTLLWMCGLPDYTPADLIDFHIEGDRVYIGMADYFKRPLNLTREEALALFIAGRALIEAGVFEVGSPLGAALDKIEALLAEGEAGEVEEIAGRIHVEMDSYAGRWKRIIEEGLKQGRNLVVDYYSFSTGNFSTREVEPLSLLWSRGYWYLQAWCHEAEDLRLFRLDRIRDVTLTDTRVTRELTDEMHVPELVGEYRPGKKAHNVKLRFSGKEGRRLVEEWPTARISEREDGSQELELRTRNLSWLASYLLRYGDRFTIVAPRELRQLVEDKASKMLEMYSED
jgi:proteasome accessory factor C